MIRARVALLKNFIPPYQLPLLQELRKEISDLIIFISTPMEPNRLWSVEWQDLSVKVQRTFTIRRTWSHPAGFDDFLYVHIPYDTIFQLQQYKPDVIITNELGARSLLAALYCSVIDRKCRLILWATLSEQSEQGRGVVRNLLRRWLIPRACAIIVNGESGARYAQKFGADIGRIFRAPYAVPIDIFASAPLEHPKTNITRILFVGQIIERKGLIPFIRVLNQWAKLHPEQMIELTIVGDGPLQPVIESQPYVPNLVLNIHGNFTYRKMPAFYAQADLFAFPTLADEWGVVVNEALAAGLPILGSRYSQAIEELVRDGETGWKFRPDHEDEMMDAIDQAISTTPQRLAEMRISARNQSLTISPSLVANQFLRVIEFALEQCN